MTPLGMTVLGLVLIVLGLGILKGANAYDRETPQALDSLRRVFDSASEEAQQEQAAAVARLRKARKTGSRMNRLGGVLIVLFGCLILMMALTLKLAEQQA